MVVLAGSKGTTRPCRVLEITDYEGAYGGGYRVAVLAPQVGGSPFPVRLTDIEVVDPPASWTAENILGKMEDFVNELDVARDKGRLHTYGQVQDRICQIITKARA